MVGKYLCITGTSKKSYMKICQRIICLSKKDVFRKVPVKRQAGRVQGKVSCGEGYSIKVAGVLFNPFLLANDYRKCLLDVMKF